MLVKNIIKKTSKILELDNVLDYFETNPETMPDDVSAEIDKLILCINHTNNTIASIYSEITASKNIECTDGIIKFADVCTKDIVDIKNVLESSGLPQKFKVMSDGIHTGNGSLIVIYSYLPGDVTLNDNIDYYTKISEILFSYGVVSEYLFLSGDINDAYLWDKKFKDELFALSRPRRNINMPSKRWC